MPRAIRALSIDLDDTLWPIWPTIERAERQLHAWLVEHAPATAQRHDVAALRALRDRVEVDRPDLAHDFSAMRLESLRQALLAADDDPALAVPAFEYFFAERQKVELFDDVLPALERLARRYPLLALTNGNADLKRVGLAQYFSGCVGAREFGVGKPDARIFGEACRRLGEPAHAVLHVGDDPHLDVFGALNAGHPAAWVRRAGASHTHEPQATHVVAELLTLADLLEA